MTMGTAIRTGLRRLWSGLLTIVALFGMLVAVEYFGGQPMGLFSGTRPTNLGYREGKFTPPSWKPNSVSSTVERGDSHYIEPMRFEDTPAQAWQRLLKILVAAPRATIVTESDRYLHVEFKSAGLGFVDDAEFALDEKNGTIQVRSAARLGIRDFNVNRERIETLRSQFGTAPLPQFSR